MRLVWLLVLFCLLLMPLQQCEGCSGTFANLPNHVKSCGKWRNFLSGGLKSRIDQTSRAEAERLAESKRREEEHARIRAEAALRDAERRAREEVTFSHMHALMFLH